MNREVEIQSEQIDDYISPITRQGSRFFRMRRPRNEQAATIDEAVASEKDLLR